MSSEGYVLYGWPFAGKRIGVLTQKGYKINCWGLISRLNQCRWATSCHSITAQFVLQELENLSLMVHKETVGVLNCARIHTGKLIQQRFGYWQQRGLFILFLPPYSPHLDLAETLWRKLKTEWLRPQDYSEKDTLFYAVQQCLANVGQELRIKFSPFNLN